MAIVGFAEVLVFYSVACPVDATIKSTSNRNATRNTRFILTSLLSLLQYASSETAVGVTCEDFYLGGYGRMFIYAYRTLTVTDV